MINNTLPVRIKVLEKTGFSHYSLLINHKKVQTKSMIELELNASYLAELYSQKGRIIEFKNLYKCPDIVHFQHGLNWLIELLESKISYKQKVIASLSQSQTKDEYELYKQMLFASYEQIYHIPFVFENKLCLFQLKKLDKTIQIYLYFSVFGPLKILLNENEIIAFSPFSKVSKFLSKHLNFKVLEDKNISALYTFKKFTTLKDRV